MKHVFTLASASIVLGLIWDISWHESIGRDTFWSPPHIPIYLGGLLAGVASCVLIASATRDRSDRELQFIKVGPLWGSSSAWIALWGSLAMLTAAPFDDWWHGAYGLDVQILSPPHAVLGLGVGAIIFASILAATRANSPVIQVLTLSLLLTFFSILAGWTFLPNLMHHPSAYQVASLLFPFVFCLASTLVNNRFSALFVAGNYMVIVLCFVWILPLFPASPRLAPVYSEVTFFRAPRFPLLLIFPAVVIDLLRPYFPRAQLLRSIIISATFLSIFMTAEWNFAEFLMSEASDNRFFGVHQLPFSARPGEWQSSFLALESAKGDFGGKWNWAVGLGIAVTIGAGSAWLGGRLAAFVSALKR